MRAAVAVGIDGLFIETHPDPDTAISDAANQVRLGDMEKLLRQALQINDVIKTSLKGR
jgi:2-dehydro-3-deoxyphosphooctonate aldolase (KDO 8-P synthase)